MNTRWQARRLFDSPHRLGFVAAAAVMATAAAGWLMLLAAPGPGGAASEARMPASTAHGLLFVFGFLPLFFAGFLFTVGPRWLGHSMDDARYAALTRRVRTPLLAYAAVWLAWWPASVWMPPGAPAGVQTLVPAAGLAIAALAWGLIVLSLRALWHPAPPRDSPHLRVAAGAAALGTTLLAAAAVATALQAWGVVHALTLAALWGFCGGVFASASHRMLPLDAVADRPALEARHPLWLLAWLAGVLALQALDALVAALWGPLPTAWHVLQATGAAAAAALAGQIAWRWARRQRLGRQLVAMLHAGWVWLVLALALQAAAHALAAAGRSGALGLAPVHALALGWMGSTLFAMASRVAGAFGGHAHAADGATWPLFALVQLAALTRVGAALWPAAAPSMTLVAGAAWTGAAAGWLFVHGRWLGRPAAQRRRPG